MKWERFPRCESFLAKPHSPLSADLRGQTVSEPLLDLFTCVSRAKKIAFGVVQDEAHLNLYYYSMTLESHIVPFIQYFWCFRKVDPLHSEQVQTLFSRQICAGNIF